MLSSSADQEVKMAQIVVRQLEEDVKARLKRRAERHGRSMEEEVREILRNALREETRPARGLGSRIAARFGRVGLSGDLPELHGRRPTPADFGR
jgi:plasmid stability protein